MHFAIDLLGKIEKVNISTLYKLYSYKINADFRIKSFKFKI